MPAHSCRTTRFLSVPYTSLVSLMDRGCWIERKETRRDEGARGTRRRKAVRQIEGEVKRKVEGIERLRLEQVPLSGNGLPVVTIRRSPQHENRSTRVPSLASTVLAEEQAGKLNFGSNSRGKMSKNLTSAGEKRAQVSNERGETKGGIVGSSRRKARREILSVRNLDVRLLVIRLLRWCEECKNKESVLSSAAKRIRCGKSAIKGRGGFRFAERRDACAVCWSARVQRIRRSSRIKRALFLTFSSPRIRLRQPRGR